MSERLNLAMDQVKGLPVITLGHIVDRIEGEAILILCLVSILPFMQPIPIPGLSSVLGFIVLLQGIGLLFWGKPLLTRKLKAMVIPHDKFEKIHKASLKFSKFTSKISTFKSPLVSSRPSHILCGLSIIISAAFLSLPLPIPFSNLIPAMSIFLICLGLLEEDIVLLIMGHGITIAVFFMATYSLGFVREQLAVWL
ncbi:MAG TPA: exopolysaccharide biosynthesis protein [Bacteriovoracaceae bacterium]|nr:exopolysaccharide biosynthesis protein [Bacteriovoracaceae bacterium]